MPRFFAASATVLILSRLVVAAPMLGSAATSQPTSAPAILIAPEPETYLANARYSDYSQVAQAFLAQQHDSPAAPRVALDLLTTATVYNDAASAQKMAKLLLEDYPTSVQTRYMVSQMSDAQQFTGIMGSIADDHFNSMTPEFAIQYDQSLRLGVAKFGAAAVGTGPSLVRTALLTRIAGDGQVMGAIVQMLNSATGPQADQWRQILLLVADDSKPAMERLAKIHALSDRSAAVPFERYMLDQLKPEDRQSTDAMKIEADDLLDSNRLADALPLLGKLTASGKGDARTWFWHGWAAASTGDVSTAQSDFAQMKKSYAADPWTKLAGELSPALNDLDANLNRNVETALAISRRVSPGIDLLEGSAEVTRSDGHKIGISLDFESGKLLELMVKDGADVDMAYKAAYSEPAAKDVKNDGTIKPMTADASLYLKSGKEINHFTAPAILPIPQIGLAPAGNDFVMLTNIRFSYNMDDLRTALSGLLASDYLATREGLKDYLHSLSHRGAFPLPPRAGANGATVYEWVSPAVSQPTATRAVFTVTGDNAISSVQAGSFNLTSLKYGAAGAFKLNVPPLPNLPVTERGQMGNGFVQPLLQAFVSFFSPPPPATQPATQPAK